MIASKRTESHKRFCGIEIKPGKWPLLLVVQTIGALFPLTFFPLGVWGGHTIHFYFLCAVVQSAVIFYGMDLFDQSKSPYLWSLITYFLTASVTGLIAFGAGIKIISLDDGSCVPFAAPSYLFFALFALEYLILALIISPLWMAIRWLENTVQLPLFRRNRQKGINV